MRTYEVMFIVRPELLEEEVDKLIATLQGHATTAGATVQTVEKMENAAWHMTSTSARTASTFCSS